MMEKKSLYDRICGWSWEKKKRALKIIAAILLFAFIGAIKVVNVTLNAIFSADKTTTIVHNASSTSSNNISKSDMTDDAEKADYQKELDKRDKEYENSSILVPKSNIIPNPEQYKVRQGTRGVAYINGNYYVGFYCGLDKVWKACDEATYKVAGLKALKDKNRSDYRATFDELKELTPYIKEIQEADVETADPNYLKDVLYTYMKDTVIMNCKSLDNNIMMKVGWIFGGVFLKEFFGTTMMPDMIKMANKTDNDKYPALNENILE